MILVCGPDELLVREVVRNLNERGQLAKAIEPDAHVFTEVVETRASAVVGLLPRRPRASEDEACLFVKALTEASSAPSAPRIVLVTPAPSYALHVRLLKRSGAPYVLIASEAVIDTPGAAYLPKRPVWVARDALCDEHAVATQEALLDAIADAVGDDSAVGVERVPQRVGWDVALRALGVRVRVVPAWLGHLAWVLRQPAICRDASSRLMVRLGYEGIARALGALPNGQMA
jgi:hypothetical protein